MNSDWQTFLKTQDAVFDGDSLTGYVPRDTGGADNQQDWIALLSGWGVLKIVGADASTFLQAHFTNDVTLAGDNNVQLSGYCSPKGRLLAVFYLVATEGDYYLVMPEGIIDSVQKRLEIFANMPRPGEKQKLVGKVARTDVQLTNETATLQVVGISGVAAVATALTHLGIDAQVHSDQSTECVHYDAITKTTVLKVPNSVDRYLCIGTFESLSGLWSQVRKKAVPAPADRWKLADIRSGIPTVVSEIQDKFIPQMLNLHLLGGVSFTKGCYPGQEIVARMQYLGKLKRLMLRYSFVGDAVQPGAAVATAEDTGAGIVLSSSPVGDGTSEALVVIKTSALGTDDVGNCSTLESSPSAPPSENGSGHKLNLMDGTILELRALPYAVSDTAAR